MNQYQDHIYIFPSRTNQLVAMYYHMQNQDATIPLKCQYVEDIKRKIIPSKMTEVMGEYAPEGVSE